jgi:NhaP-type Na+/H+ or K+/H+ antiporter/rhodanese-related sulfurtransferase
VPIAAADISGFAASLALLGVVLLLAGLFSGWVERSGTPQVAVFLALGAIIGPFGMKAFDIPIDSEALRIVSTLTLALILFTEALTLDFREVKKNAKLAMLILGPGTVLAMLAIAGVSHTVLKIELPMALILGAALASTDPVLLRPLLRWTGLPKDTRLALRLESGLNDVVLLPVIIVCIATMMAAGEPVNIPRTIFQVLVMSPISGALVGLLAVATLTYVRRAIGIKREYESLYSLGVCFVSFGVAEAIHASGFVAAFAAGAVIATLDVELCDCFHEYGETTGELAVLSTFVLLGVSVVWSGFDFTGWDYALVVVLALVARPAALWFAVSRTGMKRRSKITLAWFGPRGLSSILMVLIPVFADVPGAAYLFKIACSVMLVSIVLHGGTVMWLERQSQIRKGEKMLLPTVGPGPVVSVSEVLQRKADGEDLIFIDARSNKSYLASSETIPDSMRVDPDRAVTQILARGISQDRFLVAYCGCPNDRTSRIVAGQLRAGGFVNANALDGGWDAWIAAGQPLVSKNA